MIAETLLKHLSPDTQLLHQTARHICYSVDIIRHRVADRHRFRTVLLQAASNAIASGARPTALWYYETILKLMQLDPWKDCVSNVHYQETLEVYTGAAELRWYQGQSTEALSLLSSMFEHARTAADKAPAWILQSRISTQKGETLAAFKALKTSLAELGLEFEMETSWEVCDREYQDLRR